MEDERKFLHDIMNKLAVVKGNINIVTTLTKKSDFDSEKIREKIQKAEKALFEAETSIHQRKEQIKENL